MDNFNNQLSNDPALLDLDTIAISKSFISRVFSWMFAGLVLSGIASYMFAHSGLFERLFLVEGGGGIMRYVIMFAPLGFIFLIGGAYNKFSATVLGVLFTVFAVLMGMSFSYIFWMYSMGSIINIFMSTAGVFGVMAFLGYTTTTDLTKLGNILIIGLICGIVISLINYFLIGSTWLEMLISVILLIIFIGLTAYDMQKIKHMAMVVEEGSESARKMAIMGALNLYLDFINIFLLLLRLFGGRD